MKRWHSQFVGTVLTVILVTGAAMSLMLALVIVEYALRQLGITPSIHMTSEQMTSFMASLAEVLAAVLGLSLTVVAIVVQLASQRYSAKIAELFMQDRTNQVFGIFMVLSCIYVVLFATLSRQTPKVFAFWGAIVLAILDFGLLLPYFRHVFSFLQPQSIIRQIELSARQAIARAIANVTPDHQLQDERFKVATSVERIADICLASITQSDRNLSLNSIRTLERFVVTYLNQKQYLPPAWSHVSSEMFIGISDEFRREIANSNTWIEAHVLMELEHVMRRHIQVNEVLTQIASSTKQIGQGAIDAGDDEVLDLCVRFFNTFIRHTLNAKNVRGVYNLLYQYRQLSEGLMAKRPEMARKIVDRLVYYGRLANEMKVPFATVTVAHDVHTLCKVAYELPNVDVMPLMRLFLLLDQPSEGKSEELALLGVRKAQTLLGAFFLSKGEWDLAICIQQDMRDEPQQRLKDILAALLRTEARKFWEITDRGIDFDYVEPTMKPFVLQFLEPLIHSEEQQEFIALDDAIFPNTSPYEGT